MAGWLVLSITVLANPGWEAKLAAVAKERAPGTTAVGGVYEGSAEKKGGRTDWHVELDPSNCYWFIGMGDEGVKGLSLFLFSPKENAFSGRLATERSKGSSVVMMHCPEESGMHRVQAKVTEGAGAYALAIFAKPAPKKVVAPPGPDLLAEVVEREARAVAPGAERVGELYTGTADVSNWFTQMTAGKCYWVIVAGDAENIDELNLYLWDSADERVTQSYAKEPKTSIGHCPKTTGMYKIQVKITDGSGEYRAGVYAK
jgi:hypothetical protein